MKILVTVKRVVDYEARLKISSDKKFIDTNNINMISNPFDEIAIEAALQIKEKYGGEVVVVSIGEKDSQQNIRTALAMGANRGILVTCDLHNNFINTEYTANILFKIVKDENPDIIIMGKQAIDTDNHQISEYLAELLNVGNASQANNIKINQENKEAHIIKEVDGGLQTIVLSLPCVISTDLRLNEPRYASLPGIMKAKRKPLKIIDLSDLNIDLPNQICISNMRLQATRKAGSILKNIDELLEKIKTDIKSL
jgi:electron transfer flavoprotein beta subunit